MCGIFAIFLQSPLVDPLAVRQFRDRIYAHSKTIRHRGPDRSGLVIIPEAGVGMAHERLAINGTSNGLQPFKSGGTVVTVNGEIYNHLNLERRFGLLDCQSGSDCEVILRLYQSGKYGSLVEMVGLLEGIFAFILFDQSTGRAVVARDPVGVVPLYWGRGQDGGSLWFGSEMKAIQEGCEVIYNFPPGSLLDFGKEENFNFIRYYCPPWWDEALIPKGSFDSNELRDRFCQAVHAQMMSQVPFGILLSGGLDSSLIAAVAVRKHSQDNDCKLKTFSVGMLGSPDLEAARRVAGFLGTEHHECIFTAEEGIDALRDLVWHLETYDVTTIRASTPMFLLARYVRAHGIKMVLSGEGSDEIFGGYLYFHSAPSPAAFHAETVGRVKGLHLSDCLRANKATMAWGLEVRPPFLHTPFLDYALSIDPGERMPRIQGSSMIEKWILRKAFDCPEDPFLPPEILWRQKEQFSDGVGYGWIDGLRLAASHLVSPQRLALASTIFPIDTPKTAEAFLYRSIFDRLFPGEPARATVQRWVPKTDWGCPEDPSGRAQQVHQQHI